LIIGRGDNKNQLNEYIKKNRLKNYIKIINFKDNPFVYIKKSQVFILSSLYEGLPNVLLESLVLKKLIISSNCPTGPREILDNGKGGLLFEGNNEFSLYDKILFYTKNRKKCSQIVNHGYKKLHRFNFKINLNKYVELLK